MNKEGNKYGLNTKDYIVDPHLIKNTEWGAVAYLSKSKYGIQTENVRINNSSDFITGNAGGSLTEAQGVTHAYNTTEGMKASTTGNVYGIYDMSGGGRDAVAAYVANGHENLSQYAEALANAASKYKDEYKAERQWTAENPDTPAENYAVVTPTVKHYGDAIYETSVGSVKPWEDSWYSNTSMMPYAEAPTMGRGGDYRQGIKCGMFAFDRLPVESNEYVAFHVVLTVF